MTRISASHLIFSICIFLSHSLRRSFCHAMVISSPKVFCFGDSLTAGSSPPLTEDFPYSKHLQEKLRTAPRLESSVVRWRGYPGWTASALLNEGGLPTLLDNIHASAGTLDLVIILAGTNDLAYESDFQKILDSIIGIHNIVHEKGAMTLALGIPPSGWQAQSISAKNVAATTNSALESWAKGNEKVLYCPFPIQNFDRNNGFWCPDGLHFTPDGYKHIGESLAPIVADVLHRKYAGVSQHK